MPSFSIGGCYLLDTEGGKGGGITVSMVITEGKTVQTQIINTRISRKLKYDEPAIASLTKTKLTNEMRKFLLTNMDDERMTDELVEYWLQEEYPNWVHEEDATYFEEGNVDVPDLVEENEGEADAIFQEEEI